MARRIPTRRALLSGTAAAFAGAMAPRGAEAAGALGEAYTYEVRRGDDEWRALLTPEEYLILREGGTELPRTSPLWNETRSGQYRCKGCGLTLYDSGWKVGLDIGWLFFRHARTASVLMSVNRFDTGPVGGPGADQVIEAHCRRCASHLGHILTIEGETLHCVNGLSLSFEVSEA